MSTHLIYDRLSVEVDTGVFMTLVLSGDNNTYGFDDRLERSWSLMVIDDGLPFDTLDGWAVRIDECIERRKKRGYKSFNCYKYKSRPMSFGMMRGMYLNAAKSSITLDQLVRHSVGGFKLAPSSFDCEKYGVEHKSHHLKTGDDFVQVYGDLSAHYGFHNIDLYAELDCGDDFAVRVRKVFYPVQKERYTQDHYFEIKVDGVYFHKLTRTGLLFFHSRCPSAYRAPTRGRAVAQMKRIVKKFNNVDIEVNKVCEPAVFTRMVRG